MGKLAPETEQYQSLSEVQSRPSLPSVANTTQPIPVSMSLSRRHFGHAKDKAKIPRLVT